MSLKNCNQLLQEYKNQLNRISINDVDYKMSLGIAVANFFYEMKKIDKNFFLAYFNDINEENFIKNKVQKDAFNYLFLLIVKSTKNSETLNKFFPDYLDSQSITQSNWRVIRWLQDFIFWLFKPKKSLNNSSDAIRLLNALRDIKHRTKNNKAHLLDIDLEIKEFKSLTFIIEKFLESRASPLIYIPIDEDELLKESDLFYKKQLSILNTSDLNREYSDIDTLLKYLRIRIKLLPKSDIKIKLSKDLTLLKALVFDNEFSLFEKKVGEIKKFINHKQVNKSIVRISGIYNLIEGIKQRLELTTSSNEMKKLVDENITCLISFKPFLILKLSEIKFHYEKFRENVDKQYELCYGNNLDAYDTLNKLDEILYVNKNLFFHLINTAYCSADYENLLLTLDKLEMLAKELGDTAKKIDSKSLENDMLNLSQFISMAILTVRMKFREENFTNSHSCIQDSVKEIGVYEESDGWETESDISETTSSAYLSEREEGDGQSHMAYPGHILTQFANETLPEREEGDGQSDSDYSDHVFPHSANTSFSEREEGDGQSDSDYSDHVFPHSTNMSFSEREEDDGQSENVAIYNPTSTSSLFFRKHEATDSCQQSIQDTLSVVKLGCLM